MRAIKFDVSDLQCNRFVSSHDSRNKYFTAIFSTPTILFCNRILLSIQFAMAQTSRSPTSPDAVERVGNLLDVKSVASNCQYSTYPNARLAQGQENLSFEKMELQIHPYDNPAFLTESANAANPKRRRKRNELYQLKGPETVDGSAEKANAEKFGHTRGNHSRLVLFLLLFISVILLLLVVAFIIQGQIGTGCSSQCNEELGGCCFIEILSVFIAFQGYKAMWLIQIENNICLP